MKKDESIKKISNKEVKTNVVVQKEAVKKRDTTEALSIKDFQEKYFGDFLKKDDNKHNKKLLFCCQ
ncbi:MAG: hypothetical protein WCO66_03070 [Candidatus Absconditabacteria bacterium]